MGLLVIWGAMTLMWLHSDEQNSTGQSMGTDVDTAFIWGYQWSHLHKHWLDSWRWYSVHLRYQWSHLHKHWLTSWRWYSVQLRISVRPFTQALACQKLTLQDSFCCKIVLQLTHCGLVMPYRSRSTSAQVMACCLTAPSHYLNQCWLIISKVLWNQD